MIRFIVTLAFISIIGLETNAFTWHIKDRTQDYASSKKPYQCPDPLVINQFLSGELRPHGQFFVSENGDEFKFFIPNGSTIKHIGKLEHAVLRQVSPLSYDYTCIYGTNVKGTSLSVKAQFSGNNCHFSRAGKHEDNYHCENPTECTVHCAERFVTRPRWSGR